MIDDLEYKTWGGRFIKPNITVMQNFNASIEVDNRLWYQDICVSLAHVNMLARQGIISSSDATAIINGLKQIVSEIKAGKIQWQESLEDIHTHVEARLKELIGEPAGRLHTARSRNDQIVTDLRLWIMDIGCELEQAIIEYQRALVILAERYQQTIIPGYTHLQRAQPVLFSHHMLAYVEMAWRDRERLNDCLRRVSVLPLGAAALAGTTYPIDPVSVARELGFSNIFRNSLDAVSDRDFAIEFLFVLTLIQTHLSRLAEELILWSSQEFSFIVLPDGFSTGSSIMPQKRNPDAAELIRGKTGRVLGNLVNLVTVLKGLPLSYNKDLQEDKKPVFDTADTVLTSLRVIAPMLLGVTLCEEVIDKTLQNGFLNATELADYLAVRGVPFREAHNIAGQAVLLAESMGCSLEKIGLNDYKKLCPMIESDVFEVLNLNHTVNRRISLGGTASHNVMIALGEARRRLWPESTKIT